MEEKLALLLKRYPAIWDRKSRDFKNLTKKENSFKEIAKALNVSVEIAQAKYKSLREKYRKEKLKIDAATCNGSGPIDFEPWYLLDRLSFFDDVMLKRRTITNVIPTLPVEDSILPTQDEIKMELLNDVQPEEMYTIEPISSPESSQISTHTSNNNTSNKLSHKKRRYSNSPALHMMINKIATVATETSTPVRSHNRFQGIGSYVAETLNLMAEENADACVLEIITILNNHRKQEKM
ncbi:Myb/SANT-like transcription factor [Oryctes borbonicus]|uniref:Myb/SANT-like transcription factor n=1 Tax=Oryctes borbonicus TaxID=1629725 RepID=A0A0T6B1Y6_9SCAR|nr:Myb/SANT-like transcription factor [Oryctes borbonicus]